LKKHTALFTILVCFVFLLHIDAMADTSGDYGYQVKNDGTVMITSYKGKETSITIPSSIDGKTVTSIKESAFDWNDDIVEVTIPGSVTTIGFMAFANCSNLKKVVLNKGITTIEGSAFSYCTSLSSITIPEGISVIDTRTFEECTSLQSVSIPKSVTVIKDYAFSFCDSLTNVTLPDNVAYIDQGAFYSCSMKSVTIPKSIKEIGYSAFGFLDRKDAESKIAGFTVKGYTGTAAEQYAKNNSFSFVPLGSVAKNTSSAQKSTAKPSLDVVKKGSVRTVGGSKFKVTSSNTVSLKAPVSKKITKIVIPKKVKINNKYYKVTAIEKKAFSGCKKLKKATINGNVSKIGAYAFYKCKKLKSIKINSKKLTMGRVGKGAFKGIHKKAIFYVPGKKKKAYKKIFLKRGATKTMKVK